MRTFNRIVANFNGKVRHDNMADRDYLVVPMIMLTEGVHNGSGGPLYYPPEELGMLPQAWNHKPVVVYHPAVGQTACDPVVLNNRKIGIIMNTKFENGKLSAEAWLEPDRIAKIDERIATAIEKNEMMELSTGLYTDNESCEEQEWNGEKYKIIARNFHPDHLAVLPDLRGACSIEDGAGFLRLNAIANKGMMITNEMSHGNIRSLLNSWLQDTGKDAWVEDVYDTFFVYLDGIKYMKGNYKIVDNTIEIDTNFKEVLRVTEYRTPDGEFVGNNNNVPINKENQMDKKKVVDALIKSNKNSWTEDNRDMLMNMEEDVLTTLESSDKVAEQAAVNAAAEAGNRATAPVTVVDNSTPAPKTAEEYIADMPAPVGAVVRNAMAMHSNVKSALIEKIKTNEKSTFTDEQLAGKEVHELQQLAALFAPEVSTSNLPKELQNFDLANLNVNLTENKETPMPMPSIMAAAAE